MQFGIGRLSHETNTFAKNPTTLEDFEREEMFRGHEILEHYAGTGTVIGGVIQTVCDLEIDLVPLLATSAVPGGTVVRDCFDSLTNELSAAIQTDGEDIDGILLDLHGAMVSEQYPAADERIVRSVRELVGDKPLAVVLDSHANLTQGLVEAADVVLGYDTYPHLDLADRGSEAVRLLSRICRGELRVEMSLEQVPVLIPLAAQYTGRAPMSQILAAAQQSESSEKMVSVSVFGGFPFADVPYAGASVVAIAEHATGAASRAASDLGEQIWLRRHEFTVEGSNVEEAIHDAMAAREGPIVLADLGDNPGAGGPCDGTTLLWALLDLGARDATLAVIADEQAVEACVNAGIDAVVEIPVGGRRDTRNGYPIDVRGKVKTITDGCFTLEGPMAAGVKVDMGRTVVLDLEARHEGVIELILTERRFQPSDLNVFRHAGIEPSERKILALKSSVHFRAAFEPIATKIYEVITPGITTPDPAFFDYQHVRRPIFPLDRI